MKHRAVSAASFALLLCALASSSSLIACSGDGGTAAPADTDAGAAVDPNGNQGTTAGDPGSASNGNLGDNGNGTGTTTDPGSSTDMDSGLSGSGMDASAHDGASDAASPGNRPDAAPGNARTFGEACSRDTQCASGACTRNTNSGGGNAGFCSIQCTVTNEGALCTKPLTTGKCVRGFCDKP